MSSWRRDSTDRFVILSRLLNGMTLPSSRVLSLSYIACCAFRGTNGHARDVPTRPPPVARPAEHASLSEWSADLVRRSSNRR